ncbi:MAG: helix-turn-helix domain-containing protein, partial [Candidatus Humimicrobiaceae bacterium]
MPRKSRKTKLVLDEKQKEQLSKISQSRKASLREVQRANILLRYSEGIPITDIKKMAQVSRPTAYKWIDKALAMGIEEGLKDK